jgi:NADPH-ferrihemoprotein reductase
MSEKPATQAAASTTYNGYPQTRMPYTGTGYQHYNGGKRWMLTSEECSHYVVGLNMANPNTNPLASMHNLKASLPTTGPVDNDIGGANRQGYSSPMMVLPSGQTVPLNNYYSQNQHPTGDAASQLPYIPTGMFPNFIGNTGLGGAAVSGYEWPYGMTANLAGFDHARPRSWSSNEENFPANPAVALQAPSEYYPSFPYIPTAATSQHYIAGPIQPMKCQDNKSYEMANLDELVSRDPPIPRAVPALWTNQEELSLAKCLQNPEGITNVYIRGFMPDTTDEDLEQWASRFGEIESCKAIIEQDTGKCKGYVGRPCCVVVFNSLFV